MATFCNGALKPREAAKTKASSKVQGPVALVTSHNIHCHLKQVLLDSKGRVAGTVPASLRRFTLDKCFQEHAATYEVYCESCGPLVESVRRAGRNATFLCYGQTGSGKTHTMLGTPSEPGLAALAVADLLAPENGTVSMSFLQIYGKELTDLLISNEVDAVQLMNRS
jgi:hypothetical protein